MQVPWLPGLRLLISDWWPVTSHWPGYLKLLWRQEHSSQHRVGEAQVHRGWGKWMGTMYVCYNTNHKGVTSKVWCNERHAKVTHLTGVHASMLLRSDFILPRRYIGLHRFLSFSSTHRSPCTIWSDSVYLYDTILLTIRCTISISEPHILRYLVLGEFRSLST